MEKMSVLSPRDVDDDVTDTYRKQDITDRIIRIIDELLSSETSDSRKKHLDIAMDIWDSLPERLRNTLVQLSDTASLKYVAVTSDDLENIFGLWRAISDIEDEDIPRPRYANVLKSCFNDNPDKRDVVFNKIVDDVMSRIGDTIWQYESSVSDRRGERYR